MASNPVDIPISNNDVSEKVQAEAAAEITRPVEMSPMTDWYNPWQLIDTAKKTTISTIIGANADPRIVTAASADGSFFDYSKELEEKGGELVALEKDERSEIWIDYVSDVGDGWNPTYSVAHTLAQKTLNIAGERLTRGEILIFGGDGVYPTANWDDYDRKLVKPYAMAFNSSRSGTELNDKSDLKTNPHVFVLPGNHDWYDSLVSFGNLFCTHVFNKRIFAGGWQTRQERSYFALKLPHKWWLFGVDLQLSHNIDSRQLQYFESIVEKHMQADDKVVLCVPEPYWVKSIKYRQFDEAAKKLESKEKSIEKLESLLREKFPENPIEIRVYIAGDLHHYRRFESDGGRIQKITAGGGGAFLHPTHDFNFAEVGYADATHYPDPRVSRAMDWANLYKFIGNSPYFGILTAVLYIMLAWFIQGEIVGKFDWLLPIKVTVNRAIDNPTATVTVILMLLGLMFFTDSNSKLQKYLGGFLHGAAHLAAIFILGWLSFFVTLWLLGVDTVGYGAFRNNHPTLVNLVWFGTLLVICGVGGYLVGAFIMGVYLFISLHFFGRHDNEAFSALKIEDYKNFVRMHIDRAGKLTIYPVKIERVARRWDYIDSDPFGFYEPQVKLKPEFIEEIKPVV